MQIQPQGQPQARQQTQTIRFPFHDLRPFAAGKSAAIKRPREIACFSFDEKHVAHPLDERSLRYYYPPFFDTPTGLPSSPPSIDLSRGLDTFIKYDESIDLHLDALLETIEQHERQTQIKVDADIVTWRGMMTKILTAAFDQYGEFEMNAVNLEGTIYIEENKSARQDTNPSNQRQFGRFPQSTMMYWGYKFETLSTLPRPWSECSRDLIESRDNDIVDTHAQYCSIVRTGIGGHTILIGGEVDAIRGSKPSDIQDHEIPYIELKTSETFSSHNLRAAEKFEKKMCRFWAQSFLLGVPTVIIGFRTADGKLERLEEWQTQKIPGFVKNQGMKTWDGNVCVNFAAAFLDCLRKTVVGEGTWRLRRRKGAREIEIERIGETQMEGIVTDAFRRHRETFVPATS